MTKLYLTEKEAQALVQDIESNGGDATELKALLKDSAAPVPSVSAPLLDDDAWVSQKWSEAKPTAGENLICSICHRPATELGAGICFDCFRPWALGCKPKKKQDGDFHGH
jgi:hypothetical protein